LYQKGVFKDAPQRKQKKLTCTMSIDPTRHDLYITVDEKRVQVPNDDQLHLMYLLEDHGWATFVIAQNGQYAVSSVSYIYDSLAIKS
jgi:hypothetical protein